MRDVQLTLAQQATLAAALRSSAILGHPVSNARVLETHISFVVLTGLYAYKIKKAANLGFLDFTKLQSRRFFCAEELRLNRRCAPDIYLDVVNIGGSFDSPRLNAPGRAIEYAVKMREFDQSALADSLLARRQLRPQHIDQLAGHVAECHLSAEVVAPASEYGSPRDVERPLLQNFDQIAALGHAMAPLDRLEQWMRAELAVHAPLMSSRKQQGYVREGHGDLHLGNIAQYNGQLMAFDCIEFDPALRWIDVMSDIAFLAMDLDFRQQPELSTRFLNRYLEITGDYAGVALLPLYQAYRALVRAKVTLIKATQRDGQTDSEQNLDHRFEDYVELARRYAQPRRPALLITHGFSGSGKTTLSQRLLELSGAVRIRSDLERKRGFGLPELARSNSSLRGGMYTDAATADTYQRLHDIAAALLCAGRVVVVDATFLRRSHRDLFHQLARRNNVPFFVLEFRAEERELRRRVAARALGSADASEADEQVLDAQLKSYDPLGADELRVTVEIPSPGANDQAASTAIWRPVLERLALSPGR